MKTNENCGKFLIDQGRVDDIAGVGAIDGGKRADVSAVCYGEHDRCVRVWFEETKESLWYDVPEGMQTCSV